LKGLTNTVAMVSCTQRCVTDAKDRPLLHERYPHHIKPVVAAPKAGYVTALWSGCSQCSPRTSRKTERSEPVRMLIEGTFVAAKRGGEAGDKTKQGKVRSS
jgi:hypothetical protein